MMTRGILLITALLLGSCGDDASTTAKPAGTLSDPVTTCERVGDVCRIDSSRLGVCTTRGSNPTPLCEPQH